MTILDREELSRLVRTALETNEHELVCGDCLDQVDSFAEMQLAGLDAAAARPLVYNHLQKCGDCREEFEALLAAVRTVEGRNGDSIFGSVRRLWRRRRDVT